MRRAASKAFVATIAWRADSSRSSALPVAHAYALLLLGDLQYLGTRANETRELGGDAVDQRSRSADDVAREPGVAAPDEREVPRARAGGDLLRLGRGARDGRTEHQVGVAGELPQPVGERLAVAVREQAPPRLGGRLARAWPGHAL